MNALLDTIEVAPGLKLPYVETGDPSGFPVLFLHGITDSWRSFEPLFPFIGPGVRAIAFTQRGHGDADKPLDGYNWESVSADIRAVLDRLGIDKAVIAGHSYGSQVAMHVAVRYPERMRGLVLMGAFTPQPGLPSLQSLWDEVFDPVTDPISSELTWEFQVSTVAGPAVPGILETASAESQKVPARVWKAAFAPLLTMAILNQLHRVPAPVRLIWGENDEMALCSDQAALLNAFRQAELITHRGAGHAMHWEDPERVANEISEFVRSLN